MKIIEKFSDLKVALIATIIPLILMILWHANNIGLPVADAFDFMATAGTIVNYFYDGNIDRGFYALYAEKPWRPVSFYLFLFPLMLLSGNNILFTFAAIHSIALFFTTIYGYFIFRIVSSSKFLCFLGAVIIGTISNSFFPGGTHAFAETILTPAVLATLFHLIKSNFMINKTQAIYALFAMTICFTVRPIEAILYILPIILCFFYFGTREKIFKVNDLIKIIQFIFILFLLAALVKGIDISFDAKTQIKSLHDGKAEALYITIIKYFSILVSISLIPYIIVFFKNLFSWIKNSVKQNNNSYVVIIFTSLASLVFIWYLESWRDLYIWIYQTNFGQVAKANELVNYFFNFPSSFYDLYIRIFEQLKFSGLLPFIIIFFMSLFVLIYKVLYKIKDDKKIYYYVLSSSLVASIPVFITISNTSRKFALTYILLILLGMLIILSIQKLDKISKTVFSILSLIQIVSITLIINGTSFLVFDNSDKSLSLSRKIDGTFSGYNIVSGGNIANPVEFSFEPKIANLIHKSSSELNYNSSAIDLPFMHPDLNKAGSIDIFTTNLLTRIKGNNKTYHTYLPIILKNNPKEVLIKRSKESDAMFLINPYGSMEITSRNSKTFDDKIKQSKYPQEIFYANLMYSYFTGKLTNNYNFKKYKCIDLSYKNNKREGCLLIKNTIKINK